MKMKRRVRYCVSISEEPLGDSAPVALQGDFETVFPIAAELGFDSVELQIRNPAKCDADRLSALCNRHTLSISALGTGLEYSLNGNCLCSPDPGIREVMAARLRDYIDLASRFNAVVFIGLLRGKADSYGDVQELLELFARELEPVAGYADRKRVSLVLEPIVFYLTNLINTTQEGLRFIERPGLETIKLLLDTHHMFIEDESIAGSFRDAAGRIGHVHISDSNRRYPGAGNVDYTEVAEALRNIGYTGAVSLEILPFPSGIVAVRKGIEWMKSVWGP